MTPKTALAAFASAAALAFAAAPFAVRAQTADIDWQLDSRLAAPGAAHLMLSYRRLNGQSMSGHDVQLADLQGLAPGQLQSNEPQVVRFRMNRDAGTFACEGSAEQQRGSGVCRFEPSGPFAQ